MKIAVRIGAIMKDAMVRKLIITLMALVGLAGITAGIAWYLLNDEPFLKKQVHRFVLQATGRSLSIDGLLNLDLGRKTTIEARGIRFSNPDWADQPDMAEVGRLFIAVDLPSLFKEKIIVQTIEIDGCRMDLVANDQGKSNWDVMPASDEPEMPEPGLQEPGFELNRVRIDNCHMSHSSPERTKPLRAEITTLEMSRLEDGKYQQQVTGNINDVPLTLAGNMGPIRALWQGGKFEHEINLQAGDIALNSSGTVADVKTLAGADIAMNFNGPDIGVVISNFALPPFSTGAFDFELDFNTEGAMTKVTIDGDLGNLEARVEGQLDRLLHPTAGEMNLTASGPNLGALAEVLGVTGLVPDPFSVNLAASVENGRTQLAPLTVETEKDRLQISGTIGAFPGFFSTELDISVHSDESERWMAVIDADSGLIGAIDSKIKVTTDQAGIMSVESVLDQASNHFEASGTLGRYPELDQPDFRVDFSTPDLQALGALFHVGGLPAAPLKASGRIIKDGKGVSLDNVLADLAGDQFRIHGLVNLDDQFKGSTINIDAEIASTARFGARFGVTDIPDQPLKVKSVIRPAGKGLTFQVTDGQMGDIKIKLNGQIADLESPALIDSDFDIGLPSLALLGFLIPDGQLPDLPFSASGHIKNLGERIQLQKGQLKLGRTTATIDADYQPGETLAGSSVTLSASGPDLREIVALTQLESLPRDFQLSGKWARTRQGDQIQNIEFRLGEMNLNLNGQANRLAEPKTFSMQAQLDVADVSVLNTLLDQTLAPERLSLSASLEGNTDVFDIKRLSAQLGSSDVQADIHVDRLEKLKLSGTIESEYVDLRPYQQPETEPEEFDEPAATPSVPEQRATAPSKMVFDDTPVKSLQESPLDLDLDIHVKSAEYGLMRYENINLGVLLENYLLQLNPFELFDQEGSEITGILQLDGRDGTPNLDIELHGKDIRLGLAAFEGQDPATFPPVDMDIDLHGVGKTRREIASSLNGTIRLFWGSGQYASAGLGLIFSDFITELFTAINPFAKTSEYSELECGVIAADVQSGNMTFQPILMQDKKITIVSHGTVDLNTEKLDLTFNTKPRKGFGVSAGVIINSLIKVGGTLKSPGVELDAGSAVVSGGTAVATLGISLLAKSFADRFLSSKDPCGDARKNIAERDSKTNP